jgi:hypothetical protein
MDWGENNRHLFSHVPSINLFYNEAGILIWKWLFLSKYKYYW